MTPQARSRALSASMVFAACLAPAIVLAQDPTQVQLRSVNGAVQAEPAVASSTGQLRIECLVGVDCAKATIRGQAPEASGSTTLDFTLPQAAMPYELMYEDRRVGEIHVSADWGSDVIPEKLKENSGGAIFFEQDSVLPWLGAWGGDQNYTMGLAFQASGPWLEPHVAKPLAWLDDRLGAGALHKRLRTGQGLQWVEDHTLTFGNTAFTPTRIDLVEPIFDDRPYSSLLYLTVSRATIDPAARRMLKTDLTAGMLGLHISDAVQTWIHTRRRERKGPGALTPYDPAGWDNQISDGGEFTAKYTATLLQNVSDGAYHDVSLHAEASLGYYTNGAVGLVTRVGWLRTEFWTFNSNPTSAANQAGGPASRKKPRKIEFYLFGAGRGRAVVYNALLQGQFKDSPVTLDDTEIERVIREVEGGASLGFWKLNLVASVARRSPEYNVGQTRSHTWGGVYLIFRKVLALGRPGDAD